MASLKVLSIKVREEAALDKRISFGEVADALRPPRPSPRVAVSIGLAR